MLVRRSIRTKLIVALTLLSTIVVLLAGSSIGGLRGYQRATPALILRSEQQLAAQELQQLADEIQMSHLLILRYRDAGQMFGSSLDTSDKKNKLTEEMFWVLVDEFGNKLDRYPHRAADANDGLVPPSAWAEDSFVKMQEAFDPLWTYRVQPSQLALLQRSQLQQPIGHLADAAGSHLTAIQQDMRRLTEDLRNHHHTWTTISLFCTASALSMVGVLLWAMNSLVVKPFRTLLDGSRLVAGGQFDHRIDLGTGDELSELAVAMNEMTDRFQAALSKVNSWCKDLDRQVRERTREVIQNEQLASVGFLAAGVAHEINNPLASIAWSAESLESRVIEIARLPPDQRTINAELSACLTENLRRIEEEAFRCKGITEKLLDFSRLREVRRAPTNLVDLVGDVVEMVSKVGKYRCKTLRVSGASSVIADVNPQEIRQVVLNLVTNALESVDTDGVVEISVNTDGVTASIAISDDGCGMTEEVLKHIFEPFFTRRRDGTGTGLGLSITYRIVSQHGGSLTAHSEGENRGSRMEILLPVKADSNEALPARNNLGLTNEPTETV